MEKINETLVAGVITVQGVLARLRERATRAEPGQSTVEYALILAFVAVAAILAFKLLQPAIVDAFTRVTNALTTSSTPIPTGPAPTPTP